MCLALALFAHQIEGRGITCRDMRLNVLGYADKVVEHAPKPDKAIELKSKWMKDL